MTAGKERKMGNAIEEIWKPIAGFEGLYEVSNYGRVRSLTRYKKVIKPLVTNSGYYQYQLWDKGVCHTALGHRLVAKAFVDNPNNKPCVNHKDENKLNNFAGNLEWLTHIENCRYGTAIARRTAHFDYSKRRINNANQIKACSKPIAQYTKDGAFVKNWRSIAECARQTGMSASGISKVVHGLRFSVRGYIFKERSEDLSDRLLV